MKKFLLSVFLITLSISAASAETQKVQELLTAANELNDLFLKGQISREQLVERTKELITPEKIKALTASGEDINYTEDDGQTVLMWAANYTPYPEVIITLLNVGADVNAKNSNGNTPLILAARNNVNPEVINTLISARADVNAKSNRGNTPLLEAVINNPNPEIVKVLLKAGTDINVKDDFDLTAADYARVSDNPELLKLFEYEVQVSSENLTEDLLRAAQNPRTTPEQIKTFIKKGIDIDDTNRDYEYRTALILAAEHNTNPDVIKTLLNAGADINVADRADAIALMYAAGNNSNPEVVKLLLNSGADINLEDAFGKKAGDYARENSSIEIQKLFGVFR